EDNDGVTIMHDITANRIRFEVKQQTTYEMNYSLEFILEHILHPIVICAFGAELNLYPDPCLNREAGEVKMQHRPRDVVITGVKQIGRASCREGEVCLELS